MLNVHTLNRTNTFWEIKKNGQSLRQTQLPVNSNFTAKNQSFDTNRSAISDTSLNRSSDNTTAYYNGIPSTNNTAIKSITFWLGTDQFGRDVLSRMIIGYDKPAQVKQREVEMLQLAHRAAMSQA